MDTTLNPSLVIDQTMTENAPKKAKVKTYRRLCDDCYKIMMTNATMSTCIACGDWVGSTTSKYCKKCSIALARCAMCKQQLCSQCTEAPIKIVIILYATNSVKTFFCLNHFIEFAKAEQSGYHVTSVSCKTLSQ
jgi:hypothetical protein